jgi:uncharacterized protein (TIGR00375 family)
VFGVPELDCDLQLHGCFAGGVSKNMLVPVIAEQAAFKGLDVLVTADVQHAKWLEHLKKNLVENENGFLSDKNQCVHFIVGTEVEDQNRVHHLIYLPDLTRAQEFREKIKGFGNLDCSMCGRPILRLSAERIAEIVVDLKGLVGPSHSFTPYTGLFSRHDSVESAYGKMGSKIRFLELGLSADTGLADQILANHQYAFLSSSDSHSPWPHRLGREFNRIEMKKPCFSELKKALEEREEKKIVLNAGLDPREGKYHETACNNCFTHFSMKQAEQFQWVCPNCKNSIKKGVKDRILELADTEEGKHPSFRPPYLHLLPLAEIIQQALGIENPLAKSVQSKWKDFIERFGNEISVLVDAPEKELLEFDSTTGKFILAFRNGWVHYSPGGGGEYGKPFIALSEKEFEELKKNPPSTNAKKNSFKGQKTLGEF